MSQAEGQSVHQLNQPETTLEVGAQCPDSDPVEWHVATGSPEQFFGEICVPSYKATSLASLPGTSIKLSIHPSIYSFCLPSFLTYILTQYFLRITFL